MKQKQPTIACNESVHQYDPFREIGPTKNRWGSEFTSAMEYIAVTYVTPSRTPRRGKLITSCSQESASKYRVGS